MKKTIVLICVLTLFCLTACGKDKTEENKTENKTEDKVTLTPAPTEQSGLEGEDELEEEGSIDFNELMGGASGTESDGENATVTPGANDDSAVNSDKITEGETKAPEDNKDTVTEDNSSSGNIAGTVTTKPQGNKDNSSEKDDTGSNDTPATSTPTPGVTNKPAQTPTDKPEADVTGDGLETGKTAPKDNLDWGPLVPQK